METSRLSALLINNLDCKQARQASSVQAAICGVATTHPHTHDDGLHYMLVKQHPEQHSAWGLWCVAFNKGIPK